MSRIGRAVVTIPGAVKVSQSGAALAFEGSKGKMLLTLPEGLCASLDKGQLQIQRSTDEKSLKALHGLYRAMAANIVRGLTEGFQKELEVTGVGYRAQAQPKQLTLNVGFSHPVQIPVPEGITVETPKPTTIVVKGFDRQLVGQIAANIRGVATAEPYKGKGIRYVGEVIRRKAGKAATGAKGAGGAGGAAK